MNIKIEKENIIAYLDQIENMRSKKYRQAVENCLQDASASGNVKFTDISSLNPKHRQEEDWECFDHVYVDQKINGEDSFSGYIWIPITKNLYLKSYYSM